MAAILNLRDSFQLFRFEVIGELIFQISQCPGFDRKWNGFQLFRFEVIGELKKLKCASKTHVEKTFPTIPI